MPNINCTGVPPVIHINRKRYPRMGHVLRPIGRRYTLGQTITPGFMIATWRVGLNPTGLQNFRAD
ncbi:hypothetical protein CSC88_29505 [Klebsiella pneumoniae]|nr:hypothetical protein CSC88_29505 [Klebsiella pneumoniae]